MLTRFLRILGSLQGEVGKMIIRGSVRQITENHVYLVSNGSVWCSCFSSADPARLDISEAMVNGWEISVDINDECAPVSDLLVRVWKT